MEMSLRSGIGFIELIVDILIEQEMDPYKCTTSRYLLHETSLVETMLKPPASRSRNSNKNHSIHEPTRLIYES
jgi:hypothetical protein